MSYTYLGDPKGEIDSSKLLGLELKNLGYKEVIVKEFTNVSVICSRNNYPNCNEYIVYKKVPRTITNKQEINRAVLIYNPITKESNPGKLIIKWY